MPLKRPRIVSSRPSKDGCRTCHKRRVKCDEKRPACWRCVSTGRKCDGYRTSPPRPESNQRRPLLPASTARPSTEPSRSLKYAHGSVLVTHEDRNSFAFFLDQTVPQLVGVLESHDFVYRALQVGAELPTVFNAIIAVGCIAHTRAQIHVAEHTLTQLKTDMNEDEALQQYCKATLSLQRYIDDTLSHGADVEPVLICSFLFVLFEVFRGETSLALSHFRHGQNAIQTAITNGNLKHGMMPTSVTTKVTRAFEVIGKEAVQFAGIPHPTDADSSVWIPDALQSKFNSIEHAKRSLECLTAETCRWREELIRIANNHLANIELDCFIGEASRYCISHCLSRSVDLGHHSQLLRSEDQLRTAHEQWLHMFSSLPSCETSNQGPLMLMQLQHFYSHFLLLTSRHTSQLPLEQFSSSFKRMLDLCDRYIGRENLSGRVGPPRPLSLDYKFSFSLESGPLSVLFLIALKCRNHNLRERALALLHTANRREGLQYSGELSIYADCIVRFEEEQAMRPGSDETERSLDYWFQRVPDPNRSRSLVVQGVGYHNIRVIGCRYRYEENPSRRLLQLCELRANGMPPLKLQESWRRDLLIPLTV